LGSIAAGQAISSTSTSAQRRGTSVNVAGSPVFLSGCNSRRVRLRSMPGRGAPRTTKACGLRDSSSSARANSLMPVISMLVTEKYFPLR
jgi:hypothetical protein